MASCVKCSGAVSNPKDVLVCCECKGSFHPACTPVESLENLKRISSRKSAWVCDTCKAESSSSASRGEKESGPIMDFMKKMEANLSSQITQVSERVKGVNTKLENVETTIKTMDTALKTLTRENEVRKEEYERIRKENVELKKVVENVSETVRELEQYSRRDNLEIVGVPYTRDENVYAILEKVAGILKLPFNRHDISVAHRLPVSRTRPHPNIIIRFISREIRSSWLVAAREFRKRLTAAELCDAWPSTWLYINEHLSPHNKAMLGKARGLVKEGKLAHAWTRDGKVFVRRSWDANSPALQVKWEDDIEKLKRDCV